MKLTTFDVRTDNNNKLNKHPSTVCVQNTIDGKKIMYICICTSQILVECLPKNNKTFKISALNLNKENAMINKKEINGAINMFFMRI